MSNPNKDVIDVLNDLIEYSKDGQKGFEKSAEDVKSPQLKSFLVERGVGCAKAASDLQAEVRHLGGDPETSTSFTGDLHRGWIDLKSKFTSHDDEAVLNETERGQDYALKAYKEAREKLVKLNVPAAANALTLVDTQLQGVQRNHDKVKALRDAARANHH
ncbi:PA2169 family four-helix-bundle protein [Pseudomonas sp. RP23018S]|uniref:ferritin-like domain-containing protein n=1 Tax=Pseudomonas sp. RP23018S TaxID=3096037 RepID=UPI002ACAAD32|nr:PA2169 family four-helix-bundle protein [Pseudomonas sp. RP23018S]MDZ5604826.1 PA2169 family four-helix-bundle protein [Pseudomonas sp. RP23018S]